MKNVIPQSMMFFRNQERTKDNTILFENCSAFQLYNYEVNSKYKSALGICDSENYILIEMVPYLKAVSPLRMYSEEGASKFWGRPLALSYDIYGTTDFWWLLLAVNGYTCPQDFINWTKVIIPEISVIESIMDKVTYCDKDLGKIPTT